MVAPSLVALWLLSGSVVALRLRRSGSEVALVPTRWICGRCVVALWLFRGCSVNALWSLWLLCCSVVALCSQVAPRSL